MPIARAGCTALQTRNASFDSPFKGSADSIKIPDFSAYRNKGGETGTKVFQYFMVGTMGALSALGAKATVQGKYPTRYTCNNSVGPWKEADKEGMACLRVQESNWPFCGWVGDVI